MLLKQITEWELFCVNIMSFAIAQDTTKLSKYLNIKLPRKITIDNAHAIINGLNMFSIHSASELKKITSKIIVSRFNPFQQFLKPMLMPIDEAILIRNYIAHKSRASKNKLMMHYRKSCQLISFVEPGEYLAREKETVLGPFVCSQWYAWIFMNMAILSWRLLDRSTYNIAFMDEKSSDGTMLGMVRMNHLFEEMSKKYNIDSY
ncbi:hypothetical protein [Taibaiella helva]|uniref:hypothetical protein n=1 Tax=Taibaiella helva TaxID=2301235 RepID=UPI00130097D0|nr:hypothetical protein [Taibaiella helva]